MCEDVCICLRGCICPAGLSSLQRRMGTDIGLITGSQELFDVFCLQGEKGDVGNVGKTGPQVSWNYCIML